MKRRLTAIAATALFFTTLGITPALAATDSGSLSCSHGATIGVRGEQQRLDTMNIKANGSILGSTTSAYTISKVSNLTNGTWSASSNSLLYSGSYGWCNPDISF